MRVGDTIKFQLPLGRYVDGMICAIFQKQRIEKLRVQYGSNSFAVIRADQVIRDRKTAVEIIKPEG